MNIQFFIYLCIYLFYFLSIYLFIYLFIYFILTDGHYIFRFLWVTMIMIYFIHSVDFSLHCIHRYPSQCRCKLKLLSTVYKFYHYSVIQCDKLNNVWVRYYDFYLLFIWSLDSQMAKWKLDSSHSFSSWQTSQQP